MSDSIKDAIAQLAFGDMFGSTPEGQQVKEKFEQTGRLDSEDRPVRSRTGATTPQRTNESTPLYTNVSPIDYKKVAKAVTEQQIVESLMDDGYTQEKDDAITTIANECVNESKAALSKMLKGLK